MSKIDEILEDLSAGIHASFGDNEHKYCEQHIATAKADLLAWHREEVEKLIESTSTDWNDTGGFVDDFKADIRATLEELRASLEVDNA